MNDRLIKESDVLKAIDKRIKELSKHPEFVRKNGHIDVIGVKKYILAIPSADRPQGEWIEVDDYFIRCKCSICGWESHKYEDDVYGMPYCPNCGARMKGANDETISR